MNLPLWFSTAWGAETATRTTAGERGSNASRTCGRQRRRNPPQRSPRPYAQSYMYMYMYVALRGVRRACP
eukprot:scaffold95350_cov74-Phaeocystis_antarctica.AAC.2